jgi:hypothetical protein
MIISLGLYGKPPLTGPNKFRHVLKTKQMNNEFQRIRWKFIIKHGKHGL